MLGDDREQRLGVADAGDHVVAGVLEQPGEPLAQEHGVLGDHDSHGIATSMRVPPPRGLDDRRACRRGRRPGRRDRRGRSRAARRRRRRRRRRRSRCSVPFSRTARIATRRRRRVLDGVRERLAGDEVGGRLDARRDALARHVDVDRDRRRAREIAERRREAVVEPRRPHARGDLAQVGDRGTDLVDDLVERGREDLRARAEAIAGAAGSGRRARRAAAARRRGDRARDAGAPRSRPRRSAPATPPPPASWSRTSTRSRAISTESAAAARTPSSEVAPVEQRRVVQEHGGPRVLARRSRCALARRRAASVDELARRVGVRLASRAARRAARRADRRAPRRAPRRSPRVPVCPRAPRPRTPAPAARPRSGAPVEATVDDVLDAARAAGGTRAPRRASPPRSTQSESPPTSTPSADRDAGVRDEQEQRQRRRRRPSG